MESALGLLELISGNIQEKKLLQSLDYRNKLNREDDLFTRKDKDMIADRRDNIRSELIDAFYEIGQKLLK